MEVNRRSRTSRRSIGQAVVIGAIASLLGIAAGLAIDWFPTAASSQSGPIDTLWDVLLICSVPIFVGVVCIILFCAREFRQRPGEEEMDGPPIHGNTRLEVIWTALPAVLLVSLCTYAYVVLRDVEEAPAAGSPPEMRVEVFGEQFAWSFRYRTAEGQEVTTTRLWVPQNRSVLFAMRSKDVIHDLWVPAWRMKEDVVPGITTEYRVTPTRVGEYPIVCAELCGLGHAYMRQTAKVVPQAEFDAWLAERAAPPAAEGEAAGGGAAGGGEETAAVDAKAIFTEGTPDGGTACGACHQLADAGTPAGVGPNLDEALAGKSPEEIRRDIVEPGAEVEQGFPDNVMPRNYGDVLKPEELDGVVEYLVEATK
jgi:cytochrome c oxidase subunit II